MSADLSLLIIVKGNKKNSNRYRYDTIEYLSSNPASIWLCNMCI